MVAAGVALMGARAGLKASKRYSVSVLGYDFIGLAMRLFLMIALGLSLMVFPQTIQKIKEMKIING